MELHHIEPECVVARCRAGTELYNCMREAAILALTEKRDVIITHNDTQYRAAWKDLVDQVAKLKTVKAPNEL